MIYRQFVGAVGVVGNALFLVAVGANAAHSIVCVIYDEGTATRDTTLLCRYISRCDCQTFIERETICQHFLCATCRFFCKWKIQFNFYFGPSIRHLNKAGYFFVADLNLLSYKRDLCGELQLLYFHIIIQLGFLEGVEGPMKSIT